MCSTSIVLALPARSTSHGGSQTAIPVDLTSISVDPQFAHVAAVHDLTDGYGFALSKPSVGVVEVVGRSGQIRISPNISGSADWVQLKWDHLTEYDLSNTSVAQVAPGDWANSDMAWQNPTAVSLNVSNVFYNATNVVFNGTVTPSRATQAVALSMSVYIYATDMVVQNGNQSISVKQNQIKFDVDFGAWPFRSSNNTLHFGVSLSSSTVDAVASSIVPTIDSVTNNTHQLIEVGMAKLVAPTNAFADGNQIIVTQGISSTAPGTVVTHWVFPYYANELYYDPVLSSTSTATTTATVDPTSSSGSKLSAFVPAIICLIMAAVI